MSRAVYSVGREKVREYARAVGETDPRYLDPGAARAAGHADVVAPPMFAAVYALGAVMEAALDPAIGMDVARLVHGAQEFRWEELVVAGDEITTECRLTGRRQSGGLEFFVFESRSENQRGALTCTGTWTNIVR